MEDPLGEVCEQLESLGATCTRWGRRVGRGRIVSPWPPPGCYDLIALRLPRAKDELLMLAHAAAARLESGAPLLLYGANDEGVTSAAKAVRGVLEGGDVVAHGRHCRILRFLDVAGAAIGRDALDVWARPVVEVPSELAERRPITYPGVFAADRTDPGTALLLGAVGAPRPHARVLDFGCGWGVVGAVLAVREPSISLTLLDADAVALEAAARNVPGAAIVLADGLDAPGDAGAPDERFDWIVANPPYHKGKGESLDVVAALVTGARDRLARRGRLALVVQRRLPVGRLLEERFKRVAVLAEDGVYRVWDARTGSGK